MPDPSNPKDPPERGDPLAALLRRTLQRWTMPQLDPDDRMEPDMGNVMARRPAAARMRCMLSPLSRRNEAPM